MWLHEEPCTTCGFTTFTFKRLLAAILVTVGPILPSSPPPFSAHLHPPPRFYVPPNIPARAFLCSHVDRMQIHALFLIFINTNANLISSIGIIRRFDRKSADISTSLTVNVKIDSKLKRLYLKFWCNVVKYLTERFTKINKIKNYVF